MLLGWLKATENFPTDGDFAELRIALDATEMEPWQVESVQAGFPPAPSHAEIPYILAVADALSGPLARIVNAFEKYYGFSPHERAKIRAFVPRALRVAIILSKPDTLVRLREVRREDVYPTLWNLLVIENFRFLLLPINPVLYRLLVHYQHLDKMDDSPFAERFQAEWREVMEFKDPYYGFMVHPKMSVRHMARFLQLQQGDRTIRYQASDHLTHLCKERPSVLEALTPLFKEKAFRERLKVAYQPLIEGTVRHILGGTRAAGQHDTVGYKRDVRAVVESAFDDLLVKFNYYFKKRPEGLGIPRWVGSLGGLTEEDRSGIAERAGFAEILPRDWDREIAFTHYIEQKLRSLAGTLVGTTQYAGEHAQSDRTEGMLSDDELVPADLDGNDDTIHICNQSYLADTEKEQARVRKSREHRNKTDGPEGQVIGPDGKAYLMVSQMATKASDMAGFLISSYQIRQWAKSGLVSAARRSNVFGRKFTTRENHWLFEPTEQTLNQIVETAKAMSGTPTGMISRTRLSEILKSQGRPESPKTLSRYEHKGVLTSVRVGGNICYSVEEVARLAEQPPAKPGRPQKEKHRSGH